MRVSSKIEGADEMNSLLKLLAKDAIEDRDIKAALKKLSGPVIEEIKSNTPIKTGTLYDSIGVIKMRSKKGKPFILVGPRYYEPFRGYHGHLVEVGSEHYDVEYEGFKMITKAFAAKKDWVHKNLSKELIALLERRVKRLGL